MSTRAVELPESFLHESDLQLEEDVRVLQLKIDALRMAPRNRRTITVNLPEYEGQDPPPRPEIAKRMVRTAILLDKSHVDVLDPYCRVSFEPLFFASTSPPFDTYGSWRVHVSYRRNYRHGYAGAEWNVSEDMFAEAWEKAQ